MKTLVILIYITWILYLNFPQVGSLSQSQYPIKHDLFQSILKANDNFIYYQHRLIIGHIVTLPCEYESMDNNNNNRRNHNQSVVYEWLFNGRQLSPHRAFFNANWDIHGYLTIWAMISRQTTLWCHKQIIDNNNQITDHYYYSHQITFINLAILNQIVGIKVDMNMDKYALLHKCQIDNNTCDCQTTFGINVTSDKEMAKSKHYILENLEVLSQSICQNLTFCINFYLNDFLCMNSLNDSRATHYTEFTFILDNFRKYTVNSTGTSIAFEASELFEELQRKLNDELLSRKSYLTEILKEKFSTKHIEVIITPYYRSIHYCMGPSGKLLPAHGECDLCSPGSYYPSRIIDPPPPSIDEELLPSTANQIIFTDGYIRSQFTTSYYDLIKCLPCPHNTYSEEYGQSSCLPCPFQHSIPIDRDSDTHPINGSDWLHIACTKEDRSELLMIQIIQRILGKTIGEYIKKTSLIKRAGILCFIIALPGIITFLLIFIAYILIDVGSTLKEMAKTLHPLQIQLAEISTANARLDVQLSEAAERTYRHEK
ncbi:unnamed protein product [Schistosoma bovis]|uniref:Tyrosine-protein kinase ephrin type A/B receptor-like domain-containing protein n=1 Tax=Schistosoma bovis TaxID=6184 RepID=A0A430QSF1_SCHBO|nr:uncharacterized protein DC041_0006498 [Schistosoma bovis]CAH8660720.1 unnamed protein product [Schistosoma bovis]